MSSGEYGIDSSSSAPRLNSGEQEEALFTVPSLLNLDTRAYFEDGFSWEGKRLETLCWERKGKSITLKGLDKKLRKSFVRTFNANIGRNVLFLSKKNKGQVAVRQSYVTGGMNAEAYLESVLRGQGPIPFRLLPFPTGTSPFKIPHVLKALTDHYRKELKGWKIVGMRPDTMDRRIRLLWQRTMKGADVCELIESGYLTAGEYKALAAGRGAETLTLPKTAVRLYERGEATDAERSMLARFRSKLQGLFKGSELAIQWVEKHPQKEGVYRIECRNRKTGCCVIGAEFTMSEIRSIVKGQQRFSESEKGTWVTCVVDKSNYAVVPLKIDHFLKRRVDL